ncbi:hypothetical protein QUF75_09120 [Desulfococcaceae bacterium HSG7]|nr:hypothetical protein [Desulfococcaceae bacterium HSG7]
MKKLRNYNLFINLSVVLIVTVFSTSGFCTGLNSGRIFPKGKIFIYKDGQKVGEFSKEAPLPNGTLMECKGRCGVKLPDLYLVAEDNAVFSINTDLYSRELYVNKGTVYFAVSTMDRTLMFKTDHGSFTTKQVLLNASTNGGILKGYINASPDGSELGVIDGGSMVVSTFEGDKIIRSGKRILLAQVPPAKGTVAGGTTAAGGAAAGAAATGGVSTTTIVVGAVAAAAVAAGAVALNEAQKDDSTPQNAAAASPYTTP